MSVPLSSNPKFTPESRVFKNAAFIATLKKICENQLSHAIYFHSSAFAVFSLGIN